MWKYWSNFPLYKMLNNSKYVNLFWKNHETLIVLGGGRGGSTLTVSLTVKIPFFTTSLNGSENNLFIRPQHEHEIFQLGRSLFLWLHKRRIRCTRRMIAVWLSRQWMLTEQCSSSIISIGIGDLDSNGKNIFLPRHTLHQTSEKQLKISC